MTYPSEELPRVQLRLPDGLHKRIAEAAKLNRRSANQEYVARLLASFDTPSALVSQDMGVAIRRAREARGWSQAKLAGMAGTSQQSVDRIEKGQTRHSRCLPSMLSILGIHGAEEGLCVGSDDADRDDPSFNQSPLHADIAAVIDRHVEARAAARMREIAATMLAKVSS